MSTEENKAVAFSFFERFTASDIEGALDTMTDDATWWIPVSCIAEADHVALEVISAGDLKNGRQYRQEYHMLLKFREGKIVSVREYLDTQHANDVWVAPLTEQESAKIRAASHDHARPAGGYGHTAT